jgi:Protein of unknown function (DUF4199)
MKTMKSIVLKHGLIAGGILIAVFAVTLPLSHTGVIDFDHSAAIGYTAMVLAFLLVFFGIRSYREEIGGAISFGKAFQVGILITLVTCAIYVVCWEIVYWGFIPDFLDQYNAHQLGKLRAAGATEAAIREAQAKMATLTRLYANPLINSAMTFMEPFPVGLIMTTVSALILRRKRAPGAPAVAAAV